MCRATFQTGVEDLRARTAKGSLLDDARRLLTLREELASEEARLADRRVDLARRYLEEGAERVPVPREEFDTWFTPPASGLRGSHCTPSSEQDSVQFESEPEACDDAG